jgi:anti-anti-sigma regulatory factor
MKSLYIKGLIVPSASDLGASAGIFIATESSRTQAREPGSRMFKVTIDEDHGRQLTLRLEGRLAGAWVDEFAAALGEAMRKETDLTVNLDGLTFADDRGVAVIREAVDRGARLAGGSQFIGALIGEERTR